MSRIFSNQNPGRPNRHLCFGIFCALILIFAGGCYEVHRGYFEALKPAEGWEKSFRNGVNFFHYPTRGTPDWYILAGGNRTNFHLRISSPARNPDRIWQFVKFYGDEPVRILFHDKNEEIGLLNNDFRKPYGQNVYVGDSNDFTVTTPSFIVGEDPIPSLSMHFHWTDKKYYVEVPPIQ